MIYVDPFNCINEKKAPLSGPLSPSVMALMAFIDQMAVEVTKQCLREPYCNVLITGDVD